MSNFQERLGAALGLSPLNKGGLASETGVALSTVTRWFHGTIPKTDKLEEVATLLGVNAKWLLTGQGPRSLENTPVQDFREGKFTDESIGKFIEGFPRDALLKRLNGLIIDAENGDETAFDAARYVIHVLRKVEKS